MKKLRKGWPLLAVVLLLGAALTVALLAGQKPEEDTPAAPGAPQQNMTGALTLETCQTAAISGFEDLPAQLQALDENLTVCRIGGYTGVFVEQNTDIWQENTLSLVVCNTGSQMIQQAVLTMGEARFVLTCLPAGQCCLVQEHSGLPTDACLLEPVGLELLTLVPEEENSLFEDRVSVTTSDGSIWLENISGEDFSGSVSAWYKTVLDGLYLGGISYRAGADDGILLAGCTAKISAAHYQREHSQVIFVTFTP